MSKNLFAPPSKQELQDSLFAAPSQEELKSSAQPEEMGTLGKIGFAARSALEGHTAGLSEPIIARAKAMAAASPAVGNPFAFSDSEISEAAQSTDYKNAIKQDVDNRRAEKAANPGLDIAAQVAGSFAPSPLNVPAKVFKAGGMAVKGLGLADRLGKLKAVANPTLWNRIDKMGTAVVKGAVEGGVGAAAFEPVRQAALRPDGFIQEGSAIGDTVLSTAAGAAIGGGLPVVGAALKGGAAVAGAAPKKLLSGFFGVTEENINQYLANPERINAAKSLVEIKDSIDGVVGKLVTDVNSAKLKKDDAATALKALREQLIENFRAKKMEAKEAATQAETLLRKSFETAKLEMQSQSPTTAKNDVLAGMSQLKDLVVDGSGAAKEILAQSSGTIPLPKVKGFLTFQINQLKAKSVSDVSDSAIGELERMRERLDKFPKDLPLSIAKQIVQEFDKSAPKYATGPGGFNTEAEVVKKASRRFLDERLKKASPKYEKAMIPVAEDTALLKDLAKVFGDEPKALSALRSITSDKGEINLELLRKLQARTGKDITGPIERYIAAQKQLASVKNPIGKEQFVRTLPEYSPYRQSVSELAKASAQADKSNIAGLVNRSDKQRAFGQATSSLNQAEQKLGPYKTLVPSANGQSPVEAKIKSLLGDRSIDNRRVFEKLSKLSDQDFVQMVDDLRVKSSFEGARFNGSRNVNLWTVMATAGGAAMGGLVGGGIGAPVGAAVGAMVDRHGPAMAKKILDQVITIRGTPTVQAIRALKLPDGIKQELEKDLKLYIINSDNGLTVPKRVAETSEKSDREPSNAGSAFERRLNRK
jgi:hypothetical protein